MNDAREESGVNPKTPPPYEPQQAGPILVSVLPGSGTVQIPRYSLRTSA